MAIRERKQEGTSTLRIHAVDDKPVSAETLAVSVEVKETEEVSQDQTEVPAPTQEELVAKADEAVANANALWPFKDDPHPAYGRFYGRCQTAVVVDAAITNFFGKLFHFGGKGKEVKKEETVAE